MPFLLLFMGADQACNLLLLTLHLQIMAHGFRSFPAITHKISFPGSHTFPSADISPSGPLLAGSFFDCFQPFPRCWNDPSPVVTDCAIFVMCSASHLASLLSFPRAAPLLLRKMMAQLSCNECTQRNSTSSFFPLSSGFALHLLVSFFSHFFMLGHFLCPCSVLKPLITCSLNDIREEKRSIYTYVRYTGAQHGWWITHLSWVLGYAICYKRSCPSISFSWSSPWPRENVVLKCMLCSFQGSLIPRWMLWFSLISESWSSRGSFVPKYIRSGKGPW